MKTIKALLKYKVNKKFVVFAVILLITNAIILTAFRFQHMYEFIFLITFDYYSLKYVLVITND